MWCYQLWCRIPYFCRKFTLDFWKNNISHFFDHLKCCIWGVVSILCYDINGYESRYQMVWTGLFDTWILDESLLHTAGHFPCLFFKRVLRELSFKFFFRWVFFYTIIILPYVKYVNFHNFFLYSVHYHSFQVSNGN